MSALFSRAWLEAEGFRGFAPFSRLGEMPIPDDPGVYVVIREDESDPTFLEKSTAGTHKGRDATVDRAVLEDRWIGGAIIINIGKATSLRQRLRTYSRQGQGHSAGHFGGRYIWQLQDSARLKVAWKITLGKDPREEERRLFVEFKREYGRLPYANLSR